MASVSASYLDGLTTAQQAAVDFFEGPLQVLAGPGSGKTRVITRRIARLVERGVDPASILAITFTNRAAREMQERVDALLPGTRVWVTTFHRFCANVLRRRGQYIGLESNFVIFDKSDQLQVVRRVLGEIDVDAIRAAPAKIGARISRIKNSMVGPDEFARSLDSYIGEPFDQIVAQVYPRYQSTLLECNAVDFDDLLLHVVRLFRENPDLRADYDRWIRFLLVDEYQDTNAAQYELVRALSIDTPNVCVTGDPDQSIYAWRGASIENILNFERDYPNATLVRLEHNFRSTKLILKSADRLISHNQMRKAKSLLSDGEDGEPVRLLKFPDATQEADGIVNTIRESRSRSGGSWSDFAIFYRVNSMSRELERAFTRARIPFQVAAGLAFYERAEIKDLLCYLRLIENPADQVAFQRVVNKPARGLGAATQKKILDYAAEHGLTPMEAAKEGDKIPGLSKTARPKLRFFANMMSGLSLSAYGSVSDLLKAIVEKTFYARTWAANPSEQAIEKKANVEELINAAAQYDELNADDPSVSGFLETTALVNEGDALEADAGKVTLMTMHAAKGLEFPTAFVVGVEHGLIPHERSIKSDDPKQLEEERRLLFVAMTRAMRQLFLTTAQVRAERGTPRTTITSTFLRETEFETVDPNDPFGEPTQKRVESAAPAEPDHKQRLREALAAGGNKPLLTTGAALMSGSNEEAAIPQSFAVGMRVKHPQRGMGTVTEVSGFGKRRTVKVQFREDEPEQSFIAARCPLQPMGIQ